ncbi:MAG: MBL fold metallo-hydrolase [Pedosphaera sp.]|nr:MBL fold metallo-hydrolase [Pedosphaera sp.]
MKSLCPRRSAAVGWLGMAVRFTILGSGSAGNCSLVETDTTRILIDAGFSARETRNRLAALGRVPETFGALLVTHEHSDHINGIKGVAARAKLPVYCNRLTRDAVEEKTGAGCDYRIFETGAIFEVGDITIESFPIPHDAMDPVGYLLRTPSGNIGVLTDLGHATKLVIERLSNVNVLLVETNHDVKMLQEDLRRPWSLKQRILSRHGHLSNEAGAEVISQIIHPGLEHVFLGHLSRDCNRPELAERAVRTALNAAGASHVGLTVTRQEKPCPTLTLGTNGKTLASPVCLP